MANNDWPRVAIVILSYNGKDFLEQFLPSVCRTKYPNHKVVVADNASSDDSVPYVQDQFPDVRVIKMTENYGFAGGYNQALQQVEADYYVLLNQDVEVPPNWITPVIRLMESDNMIAACQPKLKWQHDKDYFEYAGGAGGFIDRYGFTFCRGRLFETLEKDEGQYEKPSEIFWASGACCFVRASLYHEMEGLDADFFAHMEEVDLCWRLKNHGYKVLYTPESEVYHVGGGSLSKDNPFKTYLNFRNSLALLTKNLPTSRLWVLLFRLCIDHLAALYALLHGRWGNFAAIWKAHFSFLCHFVQWWGKRQKLPSDSASPNHVGIYRGSIVWSYFIKRRRVFRDLGFDNT